VRQRRAGWCCFMRLWRSLSLMKTLQGSSSVLKKLRQKDMKNPSDAERVERRGEEEECCEGGLCNDGGAVGVVYCWMAFSWTGPI
jgi:hypothetical protein